MSDSVESILLRLPCLWWIKDYQDYQNREQQNSL